MIRSLLSLVRDEAKRQARIAADKRGPSSRDPVIHTYTEALGWARKAVVVAAAQNRQQQAQVDTLSRPIASLHRQATLSFRAGNDQLAEETARAIAFLEHERDGISRTVSGFSEEFNHLRQLVRNIEHRLQDLRNGHGAGSASGSAVKQRNHSEAAHKCARDTLCEAETRLARLQARQAEIDHANSVLEALNAESDPEAITQTMADAGFATPAQEMTQEVFERLQAQHDAGRSSARSMSNASRRGPDGNR